MKKNLSAVKRIRQSERNRVRNKAYKSKIFTYYKKLQTAIEENNKENIANAYKKWQVELDKATGKGVFHKNTSSRKKSRVMKHINSIVNS